MAESGIKANISTALINRAAVSRTPIAGSFELTARCTLRCKMCYIVSENLTSCPEQELTAEQWIDIARQGVELGLLYVQLTGGEAMMRSDFREIYLALHKMGLKITLNTNLTLMDDEAIEFFKKYPPLKFSASLYGASNETYEKLCGWKNGYDVATERIDKMIEAGLNVKLNLTLTKYNVSDAAAICEFAKSRNIRVDHMPYTFPPESSSDLSVEQTRLDADEAARVYFLCESILKPRARFDAKISYLSKCILPEENTNGFEPKNKSDKLMCHAAKSNYWITWRGEMTPCVSLDTIKEYPLEIGLKQAWENMVRRVEETIRFPKECTVCSMRDICFACPGFFCEETGNPNVVAPDICKYVEKQIIYGRKIEKGRSVYEI